MTSWRWAGGSWCMRTRTGARLRSLVGGSACPHPPKTRTREPAPRTLGPGAPRAYGHRRLMGWWSAPARVRTRRSWPANENREDWGGRATCRAQRSDLKPRCCLRLQPWGETTLSGMQLQSVENYSAGPGCNLCLLLDLVHACVECVA